MESVKTPLQSDKKSISDAKINEKTGGAPLDAPYGLKKDGTPKKAPGRPRSQGPVSETTKTLGGGAGSETVQPDNPENPERQMEDYLQEGAALLQMGQLARESMGIAAPLPEHFKQSFLMSYPGVAAKFGGQITENMNTVIFAGSVAGLVWDTYCHVKILKMEAKSQEEKETPKEKKA